VIGALVLLALVLGPSVGTLLVVSHAVREPDAIISLSSHEWERLPVTARLASGNASAAVLLTLPQPATVDNCHDCAGRVRRLERLGVPSHRVRVLPLSAPGTYGEALAARDWARQAHIRRLLIVTTPYHTRRSRATFEAVFEGTGIEIGIEPASTSPARPDRWWATPYDRAYVVYEWTAIVYYGIRYGVASW
jgi:uncharacterized SAM-binding protein YcdF (DUF218 family)